MVRKFAYGLVLLLLVSGCGRDDTDDRSALVKTGLLGRWELQSRSYDGITPLIREVGFFLTFLEDSDRSDLIGQFNAISPGSETDGIFELNPAAGSIRIEFSDKSLTYEYKVQGDALIFDYEEDGSDINEIWIRSELIP